MDLAVSVMCQYARDVDAVLRSRSILLSSDLNAWLSFIQTVTEEPFKLSIPAAVCSSSLMKGILKIGKETDFDIDARSMQIILDGVDAIFSYEYFHQAELQTNIEQLSLMRNISFLLFSYCDVATDINATTAFTRNPTYESVQSRLQVTAIVLSQNASVVKEMLFPYQSTYKHTPTLDSGPYCLVSYDAAVYETRMVELLAMKSFFIVSGLFRNETDNSTTTVSRKKHFVMDLSKVEAPIARVTVEMFNVTCPHIGNNTSPFAVPCQNYSHYEVQCLDDYLGAWNFYCPPDLSTNLSCSRILDNVTSDYSESCGVEYLYNLNASIVCVCQKNLIPYFGDRIVVVEFRSVLVFVVIDFIETLFSIQFMSSSDILHNAMNISLLVIMVCILCAVLAYVDSVDAQQAKDALVDKKGLKKFSQADTEEENFVSKYLDADNMFPVIFRHDAFYQMFIEEIKKSHRWISLCFRHDAEYPRYLKFLFLLSVVNCMIFFNTLLFNWVHLDAERCGVFESVSECLKEPSKFSSHKSMCFWDREKELSSEHNMTTLSGYCYLSEPASSGDMVLTAAAISAFLSIPVVILLEVIVVYLLCQPGITPNQVVPSSLIGRKIDGDVSGIGRSRCGFLSRKKHSRVDIHSKEGLVYDMCIEIRQIVFDLKQYRMKLKSKALQDFDSRWGFTGSDIESFLLEIEEHLRRCTCAYANENKYEVVVGKSRRTFSAWFSFANDPLRPSFKSNVFCQLWDDILQARLKADIEIDFMHKSTKSNNDIKGDHMIMLFKQDLLQGIHSDVLAKLFVARLLSQSSSAMARMVARCCIPLSRGLRRLVGFILLFLLNVFFLLYILLFSLHQTDAGYQKEWLKGFLFWLVLELTFLSTMSMILCQMVPAFLAFKDLKEVHRLLRATVVAVFHDGDNSDGNGNDDAFRITAGEVVRDCERQITVQPVVACEEPFNTSPYFFVSRRLAEEFPDLIESKVIKQFRSVIPNRPYSHRHRPMHDNRVKLRWAAVVQSTTVVIAYTFMALMSTIPSLGYYVFSVIGWLLFGFLSHIGNFQVLGVHIRFSGYFFLVFVLLFYGCLFLIGQKAVKFVRKEFKVGRASLLTRDDIRLRVNKAKLLNAASRIGKLKVSELNKLNSVVPEDGNCGIAGEESKDERQVDDCKLQVIMDMSGTGEQNKVKTDFPAPYMNVSEDEEIETEDVKENQDRTAENSRIFSERQRLWEPLRLLVQEDSDSDSDEDIAIDFTAMNLQCIQSEDEYARQREHLSHAWKKERQLFEQIRDLVQEDSDSDNEEEEADNRDSSFDDSDERYTRRGCDTLEVLQSSNYLEPKSI